MHSAIHPDPDTACPGPRQDQAHGTPPSPPVNLQRHPTSNGTDGTGKWRKPGFSGPTKAGGLSSVPVSQGLPRARRASVTSQRLCSILGLGLRLCTECTTLTLRTYGRDMQHLLVLFRMSLFTVMRNLLSPVLQIWSLEQSGASASCTALRCMDN